MTAPTHTKRWAEFTLEEKAAYRAARREEDDRICDEAAAVLADPAQVLKLVDTLMTGKLSAHILGYSLRNQTLLISQAWARGIPLSDVRGQKQWRDVGRSIRTPGLRITAKMGDEDERRTAEETAPPTATDGTRSTDRVADSAKPERPRFRMISVWNYSQTTGADDHTPEPVPGDPATLLFTSLANQLQRHGWRIVQDAADAPPRTSNIDPDTTTIALQAGWRPRDRIVTLALALAQILTAGHHPR